MYMGGNPTTVLLSSRWSRSFTDSNRRPTQWWNDAALDSRIAERLIRDHQGEVTVGLCCTSLPLPMRRNSSTWPGTDLETTLRLVCCLHGEDGGQEI